jgi:hypothetical protein
MPISEGVTLIQDASEYRQTILNFDIVMKRIFISTIAAFLLFLSASSHAQSTPAQASDVALITETARYVPFADVPPPPTCTCSLTVVTGGGMYNPLCDATLPCAGGPQICDHCTTFGIRNDGDCCIEKFKIHPTAAGYCFNACGATDTPTHPSWLSDRDLCSPLAQTVTGPTQTCDDNSTCTGLCPGKMVIFKFCQTSSGNSYYIDAEDHGNNILCTITVTP